MNHRHRLRARADFARVLRHGSSVAGPGFVLYHLRRDERKPSRFGFSVTRKAGGAVARNRAKRLLREACRLLIPRMRAPADVVVVVRGPIGDLRSAELRTQLQDAAGRAGLTRPLQTKEGTST